MEHLQQEKIIVYCLRQKQTGYDEEQGFVRPIFEETIDGLVLVDESVYKNNGLIRVTKGYSNCFKSDSEVYRVEANISNAWDEISSHSGHSKYATYDKLASLAKYMEVCQLVEGDFPNPSSVDGMTCFSDLVPRDGFFISCINSEEEDVIIGPLDVLKESVREERDGFTFKYKGPEKPFGGKWGRISTVPHSSLVFNFDLIPEGVVLAAGNRKYVVNCDNLPLDSSTQIDLSSDENIIKWASKLFRSYNPKINSQLPKLKEQISSIPIDIDLPSNIFNSRKLRLVKLPEKLSKMEGFGEILSEYLRSDEGKNTIRRHVDTNRDSLLNRYFEEELQIKISEAEEKANHRVASKIVDLQNLQDEISELEFKAEELRSSEIGVELEEMKNEVQSLREEKHIVYTVDELQTHKKILNDEIEQLKNRKSEAKNLLEEMQRKLKASQQEHTSNLIDLKIGLDALSGNMKSGDDVKVALTPIVDFEKIDGQGDEAKLDVVKKITNNLIRRGRNVSQDDVAVLLTCVIQSLVVTLAGKPGSGKTSTVIELANILGIKKGNRYSHVQVQRGWSSDRDILGFYNKLSHCYEPDRYGLYKLINGLQSSTPKNQFSIALLDEANLSPIEHYWSSFMGACDDIDSFSISSPKQGEFINLPNGLRFIATVNYDRTTEPLSARFLDRSPVIYLENSVNDLLTKRLVDEESECLIEFSFLDLESLFKQNESSDLKIDEKRILEEILEDHKFLDIQNRKVKAIFNFTDTLRFVLSEDKSEMLKALDYAILVHVLPMIAGQGRSYAAALKSFSSYLDSKGLLNSLKRVNTIINNSQFEAFSYFS